ADLVFILGILLLLIGISLVPEGTRRLLFIVPVMPAADGEPVSLPDRPGPESIRNRHGMPCRAVRRGLNRRKGEKRQWLNRGSFSIKSQQNRQRADILEIFDELEKRIGDEEYQAVHESAINPVGLHHQFGVVAKQ